MKKLIIIALICLTSVVGYSQNLNGKIKIGSITLRDSSGVLVIDSRLKVNSSSWLPIKAIDQTGINGNGLAVINDKLSIVPGKGLNVINDSLTYTGADLIQVDHSQMYIDDQGVYRIKPYISFDSLIVSGHPISKTDSNEIRFNDVYVDGKLTVSGPINLYSTNPKINFGPFTHIITSKFAPYDMYFEQVSAGPFHFVSNASTLVTIAPDQITTHVPVVTNQTVTFMGNTSTVATITPDQITTHVPVVTNQTVTFMDNTSTVATITPDQITTHVPVVTNQTVTFNNRILGNIKPITVEINLTLTDANCFILSSGDHQTASVEAIDTTGWTDGSIVTFLLLNDITFVNDNGQPGSVFSGLRMLNGETVTLSAETVISLMYSASFNLWIEIGRNR